MLFLFSGVSTRADGLPQFLRQVGTQVDCMDIVNSQDIDQDISDDAVWERVRSRLAAGYYHFVFASPPCRTFSEARTRVPGPPVLRNWEHRYGFPKTRALEFRLKHHHFEQLRLDNLLAERSAEACNIMDTLGRGWAVEQPFPWADSVSMFDLDSFVGLFRAGAVYVIFDQCQYGAVTAKPTRLLCKGADFSSLHQVCQHTPEWREGRHGRQVYKRHPPVVGKRGRDGAYATSALAAYPADLNLKLAEVISSFLSSGPGSVQTR
jgi:hypothetical protein